MAFTRITSPVLAAANVGALDDRPLLTAAQLKATFDKAGEDILVYLTALAAEINGLIDELEAVSLAGADGQSAYEAAVAGGYSGTESAFYTDLAAMDGLAAALAAL